MPEEYRTGIAEYAFFGSPNGIIGYDAMAMYRDGFWEPINSVDDPNANDGDRINNVPEHLDVNEKLTTAFVKVGIDTELGGLPLRGNIGVQAVTGRPDVGSAADERGRSRPNTPSCRRQVVDRRRQVHGDPAEPEPRARVAARHEAALRRGRHRGASAHG